MLLPAMCARSTEGVHGGEHRAREPGRVVRCADRLVRLAEARQVERHDPVAVGQRAHRWEERRLRPSQAVEAHDRLAPGPGGEHRDRAKAARADRVELEPAALVRATGGRQEAHAQVQAPADPQTPGAKGLHPSAHIVGDAPPGGGVRAQDAVRVGRVIRIA
jgi:hypothetical protein